MVIIAKDSSKIPRFLKVDSDGELQVDVLTSSSISGRPNSYKDTNFVVGDSPATLDVNANLGRNGKDGFIVNDGAGDIDVEISNNGTNWSNKFTLKSGEVMSLTSLDIDSIRLTWVADSAYRVFVV